MTKRKQIDELYYIRAIAALGILIIHATGSFAVTSEFGSKAMYLGIFANQFFRFGSPIFMMISGLVLFYNYRSMEEFDAKKFYKKKLVYILIPYIIWSIIYFSYRFYYSNIVIEFSHLKLLLEDILWGTSYSHLYFIILIFQFYLILPLLIKYLSGFMKEKPIKMFLTLFVLQAIVLVYGKFFKNPNATGLVAMFNKYYWKSIFAWFFYFLTGGILGIHYETVVKFIERNIKRILFIYLLITSFYIGEVYYSIFINAGRKYYDSFGSIRPQTLIYATISMPILIWITRKMIGKFNLLKDFGTYSLGIYFAHPLVLQEIKTQLFKRYTPFLGYSRISSLFILVSLGIILTFSFVLIIATLKHRWLLLGRIPQFKIKRREKETENKKILNSS